MHTNPVASQSCRFLLSACRISASSSSVHPVLAHRPHDKVPQHNPEGLSLHHTMSSSQRCLLFPISFYGHCCCSPIPLSWIRKCSSSLGLVRPVLAYTGSKNQIFVVTSVRFVPYYFCDLIICSWWNCWAALFSVCVTMQRGLCSIR